MKIAIAALALLFSTQAMAANVTLRCMATQTSQDNPAPDTWTLPLLSVDSNAGLVKVATLNDSTIYAEVSYAHSKSFVSSMSVDMGSAVITADTDSITIANVTSIKYMCDIEQ